MTLVASGTTVAKMVAGGTTVQKVIVNAKMLNIKPISLSPTTWEVKLGTASSLTVFFLDAAAVPTVIIPDGIDQNSATLNWSAGFTIQTTYPVTFSAVGNTDAVLQLTVKG